MIRHTEVETYQTAWALPQYHDYSPGEQFVPMFLEMTGAKAGQTVLDAGCGSGRGAIALAAKGFEVRCCDFTDDGLIDDAKRFPFTSACLWDSLIPSLPYMLGRKFDWVYCCDVLEHVPPVFAMLVVSRLLEVAKRGVFLSISTVQDNLGPWIGKNLHQNVQDFVVWRDQLKELGTVTECRDLLINGLFVVVPR